MAEGVRARRRRAAAPRPRPERREEAAPPSTRADWVDRRLRSAILSGELRPGERLAGAALAERFSVSPTPLREAIQRLAARGLVEIRPQRGAIVAPVSSEEAREIYELRQLLEPMALRDSIEHGDPAHRREIEEAYEAYLHSIRVEMDAEHLVEALDRHADFHAALLSRCRSRWLLRICSLLADQAQRYALVSLVENGGGHDLVAEHASLRDAALAGRAERASAILRSHLARLSAETAGLGKRTRSDREAFGA
ncbi:GntR family transcriptional regulator [bacterium]|nr:GntR family transcriptional regulator [bacterium]